MFIRYTLVQASVPKGYTAKTEKGEGLEVVKSENGLVQVQLKPSAETTVRVGYDGTVCQKASDILTLLTVLWLIFLSFRSRGRNSVISS